MGSMASFSDWLEGARLRTLPAAAAPVLLGTAIAAHLGTWSIGRAALALGVALLLQIGVNFSNDYSDGVRGTDEYREGPPRLTGGGLVSPNVVLAVALGCFALAGVLGLWLLVVSKAWILLLAGVAAVAAAWFYTGGRNPYAYRGYGMSELMVFVFFGLMATLGTVWTQAASLPWWSWLLGSVMGLLSINLLVINNLRDIPTDKVAGKITLPVRLGDARTRKLYVGVLIAAWVLAVVAMAGASYGAMLPLDHDVFTSTAPLQSGSGDAGGNGPMLRFIPEITNAVEAFVAVVLALSGLWLARGLYGAPGEPAPTGRGLLVSLRNSGLTILLWAVVIGAFLVASVFH